MSIKLKEDLSDRIFTAQEAAKQLQNATADDVDDMVQELEIAVNSPEPLDLSSSERQDTLNDFLTNLDKVKPLPLDRTKATKPNGAMDWISVLRVQNASGLPSGSFTGKSVAIGDGGDLLLAGTKLPMTAKPDDAQIEALLGLSRPNQLNALSTSQRTALTQQLFERIALTIPSTLDPGKFRNVLGGTAALAALSNLAKGLSKTQVDSLLQTFAKTQTPLGQALILRTLDGATLTAAQKTARDALTVEGADELLPLYDQAITQDGYDAQIRLIGVAFGRSEVAVNAFDSVADLYSTLNAPQDNLDTIETSAFMRDLEAYVDGSTQTSFVYGALKSAAPKNFAKLTNARIAAQLTSDLQAASPSFLGQQLTSEQASFFTSIVPGIANATDAEALRSTFETAAALFGTAKNAPLPGAAFALLKGQLQQAFDRRADSSDGMIDVGSFGEALSEATAKLSAELAPRLAALSTTPATFDGITLSANGAASLRNVLENYTRSSLSVTNLGGALNVIAQAHGGQIDDAATTQFDQIISFYRQNWPKAQVFDFNKLGRIASFIVQGKDVPLCTINGQTIALGEFYAQVGRSVAGSIDASRQEYDWMPERWGTRAKASVELLDVIAQQTAEGRGPIVALQQGNPGRAITVHVTGKNGAHEQFIYEVKGVGLFTQGSDGVIQPYAGRVDVELFSAKVTADGTFDVSIATRPRVMGQWPLQTSYDVGDSIDVRFLDRNEKNQAVEGKRFSDQHKILPGKIDSYDAQGNYYVSYTKPDGTSVQVKTSLREIEQSNNPHNFELTGSSFSDINIDVNAQPLLKKIIEDAKEVIKQHLPRDGSIFNLEPGELAKAQRECVEALQHFMRPLMVYPTELDANPDENSKKYHEIIDNVPWGDNVPLQLLLEIKMGVCRHQCIFEQIVMQLAGIDSRLASGAANEDDGDFRGYHIWNELQLADNARYLSDETWNDPLIPLWDGAYNSDLRRMELYHRTAEYDGEIV